MGPYGAELEPSGLRRIPLPRTSVNKGKKRIGHDSSPDPPEHLSYGHFFRPPTDVSLFCPGGHLPEAVVSGLPFPGPSSIAANATPDTDMLSAIMSAAINNVMRFLIFSPPLTFSLSLPQNKNRPPRIAMIPSVAGCTTGSLSPRCPHIRDEVLSLYSKPRFWSVEAILSSNEPNIQCPRALCALKHGACSL